MVADVAGRYPHVPMSSPEKPRPLITESDLHFAAARIEQRRNMKEARGRIASMNAGLYEDGRRGEDRRVLSVSGIEPADFQEMQAHMMQAAVDFLDKKIEAMAAEIRELGVGLED